MNGFQSRQRDALMARLKEDGIATNVHFIPLPLLSLHRDRGELMRDYPESEVCFNEQLSLPIHLHLDDEDVNWIVERLCYHVGDLMKSHA